MRAIFVTTSEHKRREAARILGFELEAAAPDVPEIQALDVEEVAAAKALAARGVLGNPRQAVLVEDSGLIVEAWNGLPGAFTKWFIQAVRIEGILKMIPPGADRSARAVCAVAVALPDGEVRVFRGEVGGTLAPEPRGSGGFGWDPIFVPGGVGRAGSGRTYAELGDEKHEDSHRARAFRALARWME